MYRLLLTIFLALILTFMTHCNKTPLSTNPSSDPAIYGIVKNINGEILNDVEIHLVYFNRSELGQYIIGMEKAWTSTSDNPDVLKNSFYQNYFHQNYDNPFHLTTMIPFSIEKRKHVNLSIYSLQDSLIQILVNDTLKAGGHTMYWNPINNRDEYVPLGLYKIVLHTNDTIDYIFACYNDFNAEGIDNKNQLPFTRTNTHGNFKIPYNKILIDEDIKITNEHTHTIIALHPIEKIHLLFIKDNYQYHFETIHIDSTKIENIEIKLQPLTQ